MLLGKQGNSGYSIKSSVHMIYIALYEFWMEND